MADRKPDTGTDAWFKELENRLHALSNRLGDAASLAKHSAIEHQQIAPHLSNVQELIARIEDRITRLSNVSGGNGDGRAMALDDGVEYRDVPGFPGYRVGSDGSLWGSRSAGRGYGRTRDWRPLKPYLVRPGPALTVSLYRDRRRHITRVDELVLLSFVGPCPPGCEVQHTNGDRFDNSPENLRYVNRMVGPATF